MVVLRKFNFCVFKLWDLFRCSFHDGYTWVWNARSLCLIQYGILLFKFNTKIIWLFVMYLGCELVCKLGLVLKVYAEEQGFSYLVNMEKQLNPVNKLFLNSGISLERKKLNNLKTHELKYNRTVTELQTQVPN